MSPREGTMFPGSSLVLAENIERGSDDVELTADHLTHNSGNMSPSPGPISRK